MYWKLRTANRGGDFYGIILDGLLIVIVGNARSTVGFRRLILCQHFLNNIKFGTLGGHTIPQYVYTYSGFYSSTTRAICTGALSSRKKTSCKLVIEYAVSLVQQYAWWLKTWMRDLTTVTLTFFHHSRYWGI